MHIEWENIAGMNNGWLQVIAQRIQDAYLQAVQTLYTAAPDRQLPRLAALCEANPQQGLENVTAFILDTLHSRASYSTTPGWRRSMRTLWSISCLKTGKGIACILPRLPR